MSVATLFALIAAPAAQGQLVPKQLIVSEFATCVARQAGDRVHAALTTDFSSAEERRAIGQVARANPACLKGRRQGLGLQTGAIRGALAEAMLAKEPALLSSFAQRPDASPTRPAAADGRAFVIAFSTCLVAAKPAQSAAFLRSPLASPEQRAAFEGYGDTLMACMPEGLRYTSNITDVRNHVAAVVYRRATERAGA